MTTKVSKDEARFDWFIMKTFFLSGSPVGIQRDRTRPSGRGPDPGCRYRIHSPCRSTCRHGNAPRPRTGSFPWQRHIHHSTDQRASLWCDPARKQRSEFRFGLHIQMMGMKECKPSSETRKSTGAYKNGVFCLCVSAERDKRMCVALLRENTPSSLEQTFRTTYLKVLRGVDLLTLQMQLFHS